MDSKENIRCVAEQSDMTGVLYSAPDIYYRL